MAGIVAEIVAGGGEVFLIATGHETEVARAARYLAHLTPAFIRTEPRGALRAPLTWPTIVQLVAAAHQMGAVWSPGPRLVAWIAEQQRARLAAGRAVLTYTPPSPLKPYTWQAAGADLIAELGSVLITDEPGTGKTTSTVLGLVERELRGQPAFPAVVVAPASVVDPWVQAVRDWAPHLRVAAWRGPARQRHQRIGTADVYVVSYDTARADLPASDKGPQHLLKVLPVSAVADECHLLKNPQAARSKAFRRLARAAHGRGGAVVGLSGTPITHSPTDLWPMLVALAPGAFPSRERWVNRYCQALPGEYADEVFGLLPAREPEFRLSLLGQHRRVAKADVLTELPPKVYSTRSVELPPKWREVYDDMEDSMLAELPTGEALSAMSVLAKLTRLSQLSSAPADVTTTWETDAEGFEQKHVSVQLKGPSWKVEALLEILAERPGEPVVCFAPSRQLIALAGAAAVEAGHRVGYIVGAQSQTQRTQTVTDFQAGRLDLICVTTGAGGVGITLTAASTCVFLQRPWSIVEATQAEDRLHRIGAERHESIEVIDVIARNTIDTRVRAVLRERAHQLSALVEDPRIVAELLGGTEAGQTPTTHREKKAS